MINGKKIVCTIGPSSMNEDVLSKLAVREIDFFRINLSHTPTEEIESKVEFLKRFDVPVMIDTEGSQIRTGNISEIEFEEGSIIRIHNEKISCDGRNIFLTPLTCLFKISEGDLIHLDFNSVLLKVSDVSTINNGYIEALVMIGGIVGGRKGVHIDSNFNFAPFSEKDKYAFEIAKKHGITNFSLSFVRKKEDVEEFKKNFPDSFFLTKVETSDAVRNIDDLLDVSPGILIDRGDLSREVPLQMIPFTQEYLIDKCLKKGKDVLIATNTLESMANSLKPMRSEINDIVKALEENASGFVLTKETAVGKYPVETVNLLSSLIKQKTYDGSVPNLRDVSYGLLPLPHGGNLVENMLPFEERKNLDDLPKLIVSEEDIIDAEQIAIGSFSPLNGFMKKEDLFSVLDNMKLKNGVIWPLPIILQSQNINNFGKGDKILLVNERDGESYALMKVDEIYTVNKEEVAKKWFGTDSINHPGVKRFMEKGNNIIGGEIWLVKKRKSTSKVYELTPKQVRQIFFEKGWSRVVGCHTRNVIHKSHEFIQMDAMKKSRADGLFVHPVIGKKKKGDFESEVIIGAYESMIKNFYPPGKVLFSTFATYSRYGGPREALFTALVRKNFGCSHFVVGRDHTGVGDFYSPTASHEIFDKFDANELGIIPIKFDKVFYCRSKDEHFHERDVPSIEDDDKMHISGTQAREMLIKGEQPPEWFMRPEISSFIVEMIASGKKVFVE